VLASCPQEGAIPESVSCQVVAEWAFRPPGPGPGGETAAVPRGGHSGRLASEGSCLGQ
jgi:hypothetical protein